MDTANKIATLEAILFAMGESVELSKLAEVIEEDKDVTKELLGKLKEKYESPESGIELLELEDSYQLATKPGMYDALVKIAKTPRRMQLSESVLETLSIICELGRKDAPGRPLLFGTTEEFLRSFGVKSLKDLPEIDTLQIE